MSKRHAKNLALFNKEKKYLADEAFALLESFGSTKFDETVNVAFRLGIDVKQADQQVRGATTLPNGLGKKVRKAKEDRVSYFIIIGDKDIEAGKVTLEHREKGNQGQFTTEEVSARLLEEIKTKI